jgi:hypothetical protein
MNVEDDWSAVWPALHHVGKGALDAGVVVGVRARCGAALAVKRSLWQRMSRAVK